MSMTVKAYLMKPTEANSEIRRFAVDQDVTTNFAYLSEKITQMFPPLKNKTIQLLWKDSENDLIAFSSDDELTEALGYVSDGIFKVYIKEVEGKAPESEEKGFHPGVVCDGCEGPVHGDRFKCTVCPDYDLCATCENKGLHQEHNMRRITAPVPPFSDDYMGFAFPWYGHGHGHPPPPPPHHGHPPPPYGPPHHGRHPPPFHFWGPAGRGRGGSFRRMMKKCWKGWMGEEETDDKKAKKQDDKKAKKQDGKEKPDGATNTSPPEGAANSTDSSDEEFTSNEEFLRNIGQNVAQMLDPLGIDVEIDVEHDGKRQSCQGEDGSQCPPGAFGPWGWGGPWARGGRGRCWGRGRAAGRRCPASQKSQKPEANPDKQQPDVEMETGEAQQSAENNKPTNEKDQTRDGMETQETDQHPGNAETGEGQAQKPDDNPPSPKEWTIVDAIVDASTEPRSDSNSLYPDVPRAEPEQATTDPAIANALDHMNAMGFGDEGGWLTHLLEVTGGDINKALDAIRANRAK